MYIHITYVHIHKYFQTGDLFITICIYCPFYLALTITLHNTLNVIITMTNYTMHDTYYRFVVQLGR